MKYNNIMNLSLHQIQIFLKCYQYLNDTLYELPEIITFEEFLKRKMADNPAGFDFKWLKLSKYADLAK